MTICKLCGRSIGSFRSICSECFAVKSARRELRGSRPLLMDRLDLAKVRLQVANQFPIDDRRARERATAIEERDLYVRAILDL